jgi:ribonuclease HI
MIISIDGACKGNGTPECKSVGAAIIVRDELLLRTRLEEEYSSNQRGELMGLCAALQYASAHLGNGEQLFIVTDSEFIYNSVQKEWCLSWPKKGWVTSMMEPIKNQDLWSFIVTMLEAIDIDNVTMIYMKGHTIPYTKLQARKDSGLLVDARADLLAFELEPNLQQLLSCITTKFNKYAILNADKMHKYRDVVARINGYEMDYSKFVEFACLNMLTDLMATIKLEDFVSSKQ